MLTDSEKQKLATAAHGIYYWSWQYGVAFQTEFQQTGRIEQRFSLIPLDILSYLASVIAAAVVGNFAYDVVKTAALRIIRGLRSHPETTAVLDRSRSDEQNLDTLISIAKAYVEYDQTPFAKRGEFSAVLATIGASEPGEFLPPRLLIELGVIYSKYADVGPATTTISVQGHSIDYLQFVEVVTGFHSNPAEVAERIVGPLARGAFASVSAMLSHYDPANKDYVSRKLNGPEDRATRAYNVILELIENAVLALRNTPYGELHVDVSGDGFSVRDTGSGMSPLAVFDVLLVPGRSGWVKYGILTEDQTYDRDGEGFTSGIQWCKKIVVETATETGEQTMVELIVDDMSSITLRSGTPSVAIRPSGTTIHVELSQPLRVEMYLTGPASKCRIDSDVDRSLRGLVQVYCAFIDPHIKVFLNGKHVNTGLERGFGPEVLTLGLDDQYFSGDFEIPVYSASIRDRDSTGRLEDGTFKCFIEFYQSGLFLFFDSLHGNAPSSLCTEKIRNMSAFQQDQLNGRVLRVFLPGRFLLLASKLGLPNMLEERIICEILDRVHP